jgi:hypothetical protein
LSIPQRIEDRDDIGRLSGDVCGFAGQSTTAVTAPAVVDHLVATRLGQLIHEWRE